MSRALVVDDDEELVKLIGILLKRIGIEAVNATNGQIALDKLAIEPVDVVILDLMLPDMNGFEILRRVRAESRYVNLPILILSAKADSVSIRQGLDLGADGYITKPYVSSNLTERIQSLINNGRRKP